MRHLGLALFFVSFSSLACPNLTGNYARCVSQNGQISGSSDVVVTQAVINGATAYTMVSTDDDTGERSTDTIVADGKPVVDVEESDGMSITSTTVTTCQGDTLVADTDVSVEGQSIGQISMTVVRQGNTMVNTMNGMIMGMEINDTTICQ